MVQVESRQTKHQTHPWISCISCLFSKILRLCDRLKVKNKAWLSPRNFQVPRWTVRSNRTRSQCQLVHLGVLVFGTKHSPRIHGTGMKEDCEVLIGMHLLAKKIRKDCTGVTVPDSFRENWQADIHCLLDLEGEPKLFPVKPFLKSNKSDEQQSETLILLMEEIRLTTWDVQNPVNNGINYLSTGVGFLRWDKLPINRCRNSSMG